MLSQASNEPGVVVFHTSGSWTAGELSDLLDDLDATYRTLKVAQHVASANEQRRLGHIEQMERYWRDMREYGPEWDILIHEWAHALRRSARRGILPPFPWMMGGPQLPDASHGSEKEVLQLLSRTDDLFVPGEELQIEKIEMASPGGFTLRGLGEPIRELRELIKDLWYRNRQERERGELELLKDRIAVFSKNELTPQQVLVLAIEVSDNQEVARDLIESGKLVLDGEEPRRLLAPNKSRKRKKKKKSDR